jgi:hypothetical protein
MSGVVDASQQFFGESTDATGNWRYKFQWHHGWNRAVQNQNGKTGWATVLQSTHETTPVDKIIRVHKCAFNPCKAMWANNKYGQYAPPLHVQPYVPSPVVEPAVAISSVEDTAVAEPAVPDTEEPAVAFSAVDISAVAAPAIPDTSSDAPLAPVAESPFPLVVEGSSCPPVVEEVTSFAVDLILPKLPASVAEHPGVMEQVAAPAMPATATLLGLLPAGAAEPIDVDEHHEFIPSVSTAAPLAVSAESHILRTLLALARSIRRPMSYIGHSAFILMGLLKKARPHIWEGANLIDLIDTFAPWAAEQITRQCAVEAVCCALVATPEGAARLMPISEEHTLHQCCHFVACTTVGGAAVAGVAATAFEKMYNEFGLVVLGTVVDGDCGIDVMTMMLSSPSTLEARKELRIELSDYLIQRIGEPWMIQLMGACGELSEEDLKRYNSSCTNILGPPVGPAAAVAETPEPDEDTTLTTRPDDETFEAMRWACNMNDAAHVLNLIGSLPPEIVKEQVILHNQHKSLAAVAETSLKIVVGNKQLYKVRMHIAAQFHKFCRNNSSIDGRLPYNATGIFIKEHIDWQGSGKSRIKGESIRRWYSRWRAVEFNVVVADMGGKCSSARQMHGKRQLYNRKRSVGAGRKPKACLVRRELYEWWVGIRYAIDWAELIRSRRSRGKSCLARFPRAALRNKVNQLLEDHAYASLLNGVKVETFVPSARWFGEWENEFGLSMRKANRKYQVPRHVIKERLEIFWTVLFRLRLFMKLVLGYEPVFDNFDQSPFHNNETGAQNKPTLAVRGSIVPIVEGNSDVKCRWTANLTTFSDTARIHRGELPHVEVMFKAASDAVVDARLQKFLRSRGFPSWFSVTTSPKGSYREQDVISFLNKHLEKMHEGRDWRILLMDDFAAHKSENVRRLAWSRGYVCVIHGGGTTPIAQTPDTDLNEHVRREYGIKETRILIEKMRDGHVVPKCSQEECMTLMFEVLSDPELHLNASKGFKKTGETVDLFGAEDLLICREAGLFWNEATTDGYVNMRERINAELAAVTKEVNSGGLSWCRRNVERLITPYPARHAIDAMIARLGEDFYHDAVHNLDEEEEEQANITAVAEEGGNAKDDASSDEDGDPDESRKAEVTAVAELPSDVIDSGTPVEDEHEIIETPCLSAGEAEQVHAVRITIAALQESIEALRQAGCIKAMQCIEHELAKERRRERQLASVSPAVADAFKQRRQAEAQDVLRKRRLAAEQNQRERFAHKAIEERNAAVAEIKRHRKAIQDYENLSETRHAMKTFTVDALGQGSSTAGGQLGRRRRFEVLDRMARLGSSLSPGQKNDWSWFRDAWDQKMVAEHGANWATVFAGWMQEVLNTESGNAFSTFVHNETCRIFNGCLALHVP